MPASPLATVLVCTRNRGDSVVATLWSILASDLAPIEVIIVDQSDDDATFESLRPWRSHPSVHYIRSATHGLGRAHNIGLAAASSDIIAITDDDCTVPINWVRTILQEFTDHPEVAVLFCDVIAAPYDQRLGFVPAYWRRSSHLVRTIDHKHTVQCMGAGMAIRRRAILDIGGFDPHLGPGATFPSADDRDIAVRALLRGHAVMHTTRTHVIHAGFRTWKEGRLLAKRDWRGVGAAYAKPIRAREWRFALVIARELWEQALREALSNAVRLRRPSGVTRLTAFVSGFAGGWRLDFDSENLLYVADSTREPAAHTSPRRSQSACSGCGSQVTRGER